MGEESPRAVAVHSATLQLSGDHDNFTFIETRLTLNEAKPESGTSVSTNSSEDAKVKMAKDALDERSKDDLKKADAFMEDYKKEVEDAKDKSSLRSDQETMIKAIAQKVKEKISQTVDATTNWFIELLRRLGLSDKEVEEVVNWWEKVWDIVSKAFKAVVDGIKWVWEMAAYAWEKVKDFVVEAYHMVKEVISDAGAAVSNFFKKL